MMTDDEAWQWKRVIWYMKWYLLSKILMIMKGETSNE